MSGSARGRLSRGEAATPCAHCPSYGFVYFRGIGDMLFLVPLSLRIVVGHGILCPVNQYERHLTLVRPNHGGPAVQEGSVSSSMLRNWNIYRSCGSGLHAARALGLFSGCVVCT